MIHPVVLMRWGREKDEQTDEEEKALVMSKSITNKELLKKSVQVPSRQKDLGYYIHGRDLGHSHIATNGKNIYGNRSRGAAVLSTTLHLLMNFRVYTAGWVLLQRMLTSLL